MVISVVQYISMVTAPLSKASAKISRWMEELNSVSKVSIWVLVQCLGRNALGSDRDEFVLTFYWTICCDTFFSNLCSVFDSSKGVSFLHFITTVRSSSQRGTPDIPSIMLILPKFHDENSVKIIIYIYIYTCNWFYDWHIGPGRYRCHLGWDQSDWPGVA